MRVWLFVTALAVSVVGAAFAFGVRLTMIDTPAAKTLRDIVYDGGTVQQIWTGFSTTMTAYVGPLIALLILGCGAACAMYLAFLLALKLFARLAEEAVQTVVRPITRAVGLGKEVAAGGVDAVKGGYGVMKDGAGRVRDRGVDVAKAGVDTAVAARDAVLKLLPVAAKQPPEVTSGQIEGVGKP